MDGSGELCSLEIIFGKMGFKDLFWALNSSAGSKSEIWMKVELMDTGIRERIIFLWSLSYAWCVVMVLSF